MIDRNEKVQFAINAFIRDHPKSTMRIGQHIVSNLGALFIDEVLTPQRITVGQIGMPTLARNAYSNADLATFIQDDSRHRQLWVPYSSVESDVTYRSEIVETEEETLLKGWVAAQPLLMGPNNSEKSSELLRESIDLLKTIGAVALDPGDIVRSYII